MKMVTLMLSGMCVCALLVGCSDSSKYESMNAKELALYIENNLLMNVEDAHHQANVKDILEKVILGEYSTAKTLILLQDKAALKDEEVQQALKVLFIKIGGRPEQWK